MERTGARALSQAGMMKVSSAASLNAPVVSCVMTSVAAPLRLCDARNFRHAADERRKVGALRVAPGRYAVARQDKEGVQESVELFLRHDGKDPEHRLALYRGVRLVSSIAHNAPPMTISTRHSAATTATET